MQSSTVRHPRRPPPTHDIALSVRERDVPRIADLVHPSHQASLVLAQPRHRAPCVPAPAVRDATTHPQRV